MIEAGLWEPATGGVAVHDYLDYNPHRVTVLKDRANTAKRVAKHRGARIPARNGVSNGHVTGAPSPSPLTTTALLKLDATPGSDQSILEADSLEANKQKARALLREVEARMGRA
jgi:hypothetical protein